MNINNYSLSIALRFYNDASLRLATPTQETIAEANSVLSELSKISIYELMSNFKSEGDIEYTSASIPQFSSIDDCFNGIDRLVRSGLDGVPFEKMGFFLRTSRRKKGADQKYGENHIKCAEMMGLCHINKVVWKNAYSYAYEKLEDDIKLAIRSKLCLGITIIREYFINGENETYLSYALSCLSESTRKRRMPNLRTLVTTVKSDLYES